MDFHSCSQSSAHQRHDLLIDLYCAFNFTFYKILLFNDEKKYYCIDRTLDI